MTWWHTQPVYPTKNSRKWGTIGLIPTFIEDTRYKIYCFNIEYIDCLLEFINSNYLTGYRLTKDYLIRKINIPGSISLVLMENNNIVGFIYSSPINMNGVDCAYVDLMTVCTSKRNNRLATILISAITNYSNKKHYIHKKDKTPLPFPYFYSTRHYTGNVKLNYRNHSIDLQQSSMENINIIFSIFKDWLSKAEIKSSVSMDTFLSSESVKTYYSNDFMVSFAIFNFTYGIMRNVKIAEVFFINYSIFNNEYYQSLLFVVKNLDIQFLVVQNNSFFKEVIERDNFMESMDLYLHSYNLFIPTGYNNIQLPVF